MSEIKTKQFLKSFSYTFFANLISMFISAMVTFIVPKVISVESYGYFQLYLFYAVYVGFFHFGWLDGLFLKYGGKYYKELDKRVFKGELILFFIFELVLSAVLSIIANIFVEGSENKFIFSWTTSSIFIINMRVFFMYILQCTNRIKEYSIVSIIGRILYFCLIMVFVFGGYKGYKLFVVSDILGRLLSMLYGMYQCKDILKAKRCALSCALNESKDNIIVGFKLLFATIASNLVIGIVRWGIDQAWSVETFAKVSLTLSVSNLLMIFIQAVALVLFPTLRRVETNKLKDIYQFMRSALMIPMLASLVFYYPIKLMISAWLPQYADSLNYMALLFPICIFGSKMSMLLETYMKVLRKEKELMIVNIFTVILSVILTALSCFALHNLDLSVLTIIILLAFRSVFAEVIIVNYIKVKVKLDIILELLLCVLFIIANRYVGGIKGFLIYVVCYAVYLVIKREQLKNLMVFVSKKIKSSV